jgi:hypothetical protein
MEENNPINDIRQGAIPFNIYYDKIKGAQVIIDFDSRKLFIRNENNENVTVVYFSKKISEEFTVENLFRKEESQKDVAYFIFENGHAHKNWLWSITDLINIETLLD